MPFLHNMVDGRMINVSLPADSWVGAASVWLKWRPWEGKLEDHQLTDRISFD